MGLWMRLPAEIRSMILEIVAEDYRFKSDQYTLAGYASVCREWQLVFEQRNFRRLDLDQDRLSDLAQYMRSIRRRDYLEHLFLRVRLDEYDCTVCKSKEDLATIRKNNNVFGRALWNLLIILSKWTAFTGTRRQKGLTSELGAYSPSDCKHTFKDFHLERNYPYQAETDLEGNWKEAYQLRANQLGLETLNDPDHGWIDGHRSEVSLGSKQRIMGTLMIKSKIPEFSAFSGTLPKIEIVTGLLIRRQFYRKLTAYSIGKLLFEALTCLQWFRHEVWHNIDPERQSYFEKSYKRLISLRLPSTLRELYIFEDFNELLHPLRGARRANRLLGRTLSKSSRLLENLSVAFLVDAEDFFANLRPANEPNSNVVPWENLRNLALTSRILHPINSHEKISGLLIAAAQAAAFMPKLEVMEIWNGDKRHFSIFRYTNVAGEAKIFCQSNWGLHLWLNHNVVHCWAAVPWHGKHPHGNFTSANQRLSRQANSYFTGCCLLELRRFVLHRISAFQLSWEEHATRMDRKRIQSQTH